MIALTDNIEACLNIRRKVFIEEQGVAVSEEIDELDFPGSPAEHFLVTNEAGEPVGTFRVRREEHPESFGIDGRAVRLQRFCFLKEARMKGFGRDAILFAERYYREKGIAAICLDAQLSASGFYEKLGFHYTSDVFEEAGILHRSMAKSLLG